MGKQIIIQPEAGEQFNCWTILEDRGRNDKGNRLALARCECGTEKVVQYASVYHGYSKRCGGKGCSLARTHGRSFSSEYTIWKGIKSRCQNEKSPVYHRYGGRGITMCKRWSDSFEMFYQDMGKRPSKKHTMDRIDNNRGYEPSNCRWATYEQQYSNTSRSMIWTVDGISYYGSRRAGKSLGVCRTTLRHWCLGYVDKKTGTYHPPREGCSARKVYKDEGQGSRLMDNNCNETAVAQ